ncbi:hypothetical protein ElyMa_004597400 [Elysia marginata]|uniref:Uncharacterized protein n=1 Tax=Elysia marginata TaxID=1093978 RepID=A0AAV4HXG0_9GAST|nr:hypothetical protein ElyMa_004597400 [Elysia marginata]
MARYRIPEGTQSANFPPKAYELRGIRVVSNCFDYRSSGIAGGDFLVEGGVPRASLHSSLGHSVHRLDRKRASGSNTTFSVKPEVVEHESHGGPLVMGYDTVKELGRFAVRSLKG